jgi:hypothetical protein
MALTSDIVDIVNRKPRRPDSFAPASSVDVQKKFGSAKAISSDMFFGAESNARI